MREQRREGAGGADTLLLLLLLSWLLLFLLLPSLLVFPMPCPVLYRARVNPRVHTCRGCERVFLKPWPPFSNHGLFDWFVIWVRHDAREQVPLAELEGVQEHLASVGSNTLLVTSGQALMNSMLNGHEQPAVLSAVMKQQMTTRMRQNINDGMDVRESIGGMPFPFALSLFVFEGGFVMIVVWCCFW